MKRATWIKKLDDIVREIMFAKSGGRCEVCGMHGDSESKAMNMFHILDDHHICGRSLSVRWDLRNHSLIHRHHAFDMPDHYAFTTHPEVNAMYYSKHRGEDYWLMKQLSARVVKLFEYDFEILYNELTQLLSQL
jgi:hypothetical protein